MLSFYNTRTNKIDKFDPRDKIGIYTCGPTVYNRVHIGNLRTFFWSDFVVGLIEHLHPNQVTAIMNITDIDDKILKRLPEQNMKTLLEFTQKYTNNFLDDLLKMSITRYHRNHHKVTDNIGEIENIINRLLEKGCAYSDYNGSIYFDSSKVDSYPFPNFRKENIDTEFEGTRDITRNDGVRDNRDFALWKVKDGEFIEWKTNIGTGRPGWHIECSAIAQNHLPNVTLHIGGEDLKFPHHTCEILQSESFDNTKTFGQHWIHIGFLNFSGDKMSKSIGNILYLDDIKENHYLLRFYLFTKYYRKQADFDIDDMLVYKKDFLNLHLLYNKIKLGFSKYVIEEKYKYVDIFKIMLNLVLDDFDTPNAIKELNKFTSYWIGKHMTLQQGQLIINDLDKINDMFKIIDSSLLDIDNTNIDKLKLKEQYRTEKTFDVSDKLRAELKNEFIVEDYHNGVSMIKKY